MIFEMFFDVLDYHVNVLFISNDQEVVDVQSDQHLGIKICQCAFHMVAEGWFEG